MSRALEALREYIEMLGFTPGSPEFDRELRRVQVNRCMEVNSVSSCTQCARFTDCDLRLAYWRDISLGPEYTHETTDKAVEPAEDDPEEEG